MLCAKAGMQDMREKYERTYEMPFNSDQKWMAVKCGSAFHVKVCVCAHVCLCACVCGSESVCLCACM